LGGRRKRYSNASETSAALDTLQVSANNIRPQGAFGTATNAPYGFTVQGSLVCEDITATTTTGTLTLPRMTTTQRDALTAAVGMIVYNTTDSKFQGYAASGWVNLH